MEVRLKVSARVRENSVRPRGSESEYEKKTRNCRLIVTSIMIK